jgi:hypothetical protein
MTEREFLAAGDEERVVMSDESQKLLDQMLADMPPASCKPAECTHPGHAVACAIARLEDSGKFMAEIRIVCVECREPFRFVGVPAGLRFDGPAVSVDGLELRAPIEPEIEKSLQAGASFQMPHIPTRH